MYRDAYKQIYRGRRGRDIVSASSLDQLKSQIQTHLSKTVFYFIYM